MQINLLPDLVLKRRHEVQIKRIATLALAGWLGVVALIVVAIFAFSVWQHQLLSNAQSNEAKINAQVNSADNVAFRTDALAVQASLNDLNHLYQNQNRFSQVYSRIAQLLPKTARLESVLLTSANQVQLSGTTDSYLDTGKLIAAFKDSANPTNSNQVSFSNVVLNGANLNADKVAFSVTASYAFPTAVTGIAK